jgi:hypothetical protein
VVDVMSAWDVETDAIEVEGAFSGECFEAGRLT